MSRRDNQESCHSRQLSLNRSILRSRPESVSGSLFSVFPEPDPCLLYTSNDITKAFLKDPELESLIFDDFFLSRINRYQENLRKTTGLAVSSGLPVPAFFNAVSYLDSFRAKASGANLIQAQRDFFGAHTFERTDRKGIFHHEWRAGHEV